MRYFIIVLVTLFVVGCSVSSAPNTQNKVNETISLVKESTTALDKSVKVGEVFDNYQYFETRSWSDTTDSYGRKFVIFTATLNKNNMSHDGVQTEEEWENLCNAVVSVKYTAKFVLSPDNKEVFVRLSRGDLEFNDGRIISLVDSEENDFRTIRKIYNNEKI